MKPRRLPAVKFLQANPYGIDLVISSDIPSSSASPFACEMLIYGGFSRLWDTCILMVVAWVFLWTLENHWLRLPGFANKPLPFVKLDPTYHSWPA